MEETQRLYTACALSDQPLLKELAWAACLLQGNAARCKIAEVLKKQPLRKPSDSSKQYSPGARKS